MATKQEEELARLIREEDRVNDTISSFDPAFVDLTRPSGGPSTRPSVRRGTGSTTNTANDLSTQADQQQLNNQPSFWEALMASDKSPNTPTQAQLMADPSLMTPAMFAQQQAAGGVTSSTGGAGGPMVNTPTVGEGQGDAVSRLQEARQPRGLTFSNLFGSTRFDPETGEFIQMDDDQFKQFQTGLLGQLTSAQEAFQSFNPQDAASEYLRGVNAIREPLREQQTQSALSRLIQSGRLGASSGTRALAQLEREQESQRFTEGVQATQFGQEQQQQLMANQAGLFGLAQNVAQQQFGGQQSALGAVPLLQEIYSFPEEPAFQRDLAQMGIDAQKSATNTGLFGDIFGMVAPKLFGL
jgi:hypothetical protein